MDKHSEQIEDPKELDVLRAINRGEQKIADVNWQNYLSHFVTILSLMEGISHIGCAWTFLNEIDDFTKRMDILGRWQDLAPKCFSNKETADTFISDMDCLVRINIRLRELVIRYGEKIPTTYDQVNIGGEGLNEMALVWSNKFVHGRDIVALASEIHTTIQSGEKDPLIEYFLYSSRKYDQLPFDNIYDFSRSLFLAESFRQYLVTGKMYTSNPMGFADIKRKLRNECFDEYIRLRITQIKEEMDEDNTLLLDPTVYDYYNRLYEEESCVVNREIMFENFRGSQAYSDMWYNGRLEVLQMLKYFIDYLKWKIENLHNSTQQSHQTTSYFDTVQQHIETQVSDVSSETIDTQFIKKTALTVSKDIATKNKQILDLLFRADDNDREKTQILLSALLKGKKVKTKIVEVLHQHRQYFNLDNLTLEDKTKVINAWIEKLGYSSQLNGKKFTIKDW